jgi:hypothetical protein
MNNKKGFFKNIEARVLPYTIIVLLIVVSASTMFLVLPPQHPVRADPVPADFDYYKEITLNSSQVPSTLSNFPILINITDTDLQSSCLASGWDIAFFDSTKTIQYNHEIECWYKSSGRLVAWVNITSLSHDADTVIYMYYGDADIGSSAENIVDTWDSDFMAVWHFNTDSWLDSTSNNIDLSAGGAPTVINGTYGRAVNFDGTDDFLYHNTLFDVWPASETITCVWFANVDVSVVTEQSITAKQTAAGSFFISKVRDSAVKLDAKANNDGANAISTGSAISIGTDVFGGFTYKGNNYFRCYDISGYAQEPLTTVLIDGTQADFTIGCYPGSMFLDGHVNELWLSDVERSNAWLTVFKNTMVNSTDGGFFSLGSEQGSTEGTYEISGLDANTRFPFSGEAEDVVWSTGNITMRIHTNVSGTTENCTDIFIDLKDGIDVDIDEEQFALAFINSADGVWATVSSVLTVTDGGNMTLNATTWATGVAAGWAHGTNPFPIVAVNTTIEMRCRVTIPAGKAANTYTVDDWEVLWKVIT